MDIKDVKSCLFHQIKNENMITDVKFGDWKGKFYVFYAENMITDVKFGDWKGKFYVFYAENKKIDVKFGDWKRMFYVFYADFCTRLAIQRKRRKISSFSKKLNLIIFVNKSTGSVLKTD